MSFYKRYRVSSKKSIGKKFGKLTVLNVIDANGSKVKCICDCGNEKIAYLGNIKAGRTTSCGCTQLTHALTNLLIASKNNPLITQSKTNDPKLIAAKVVYNKTYASSSDDTLSFDEFLELSQKNCFYCGAIPSNKCSPYAIKNSRYSKSRQESVCYIYNGLDRINNNLGHSLENVVPCCLTCNKAKLTRTREEFFEWIQKICKLHKLID